MVSHPGMKKLVDLSYFTDIIFSFLWHGFHFYLIYFNGFWLHDYFQVVSFFRQYSVVAWLL